MNANYGWGLPVQASTYASKIDHTLMILHAAMVIIFVIWGFYMTYCLLRYRSKKSPTGAYSHHTPLSSYIPDIIILLFDMWLVFIIGIPLWAHIKEDLPKPENATVVRIVSEQFTWTMHYPGPDGKFGAVKSALMNADNPLGLDEKDPNAKDDFFSVNALYAPLGKPILIDLTSKDVIHSLFIPEFRIKQDAVPGMKVPVWVEPTQTGQFEIGCAQLCGTGHYKMRGDVFIQTPENYQTWVESKLKEKG
jgi:cytochrome c oxidase subunit 2